MQGGGYKRSTDVVWESMIFTACLNFFLLVLFDISYQYLIFSRRMARFTDILYIEKPSLHLILPPRLVPLFRHPNYVLKRLKYILSLTDKKGKNKIIFQTNYPFTDVLRVKGFSNTIFLSSCNYLHNIFIKNKDNDNIYTFSNYIYWCFHAFV